MVKSLPAMQETQVWPLGWDDPLEKGMGKPLHYSCLENSMHRGAWWATVHGVTKSLTWLNSYHTHKPRYNRNIVLNIDKPRHIYINQTNKLKPPSIIVLNISQIMNPKIYLGQFFIYLDLICKLLLSNHRRRQWQPTPVLLPGKSYGWSSLVGCSPLGC